MLENIRLSLQGVWSHKMRSFLTMLGIIIGIASIIAIVSTIQGTNEQIKQNLIGAGNNAVEIQLYQGDWAYEFYDYDAIPQGIPCVSDATLEELQNVEGVESVSLYNFRNYANNIYYKNTAVNPKVLGIDQNYFDTCGYTIRTGRNFVDADFKNFNKVVILDENVADNLFQEEDPLGKTIEINSHPFTVIGIAKQKASFEPVINNIDDYYLYKGDESSGVIYMPSADWPIVYRYDEPQNVVIKAESTDAMSGAGKKCANIMNNTLNVGESDIKYKAPDIIAQAEQQQKLNSAANTQLIWIASISLLVGGIGVMNIMLVSVTERTSEIGLKKAIGAKKKRILNQFLTEAVVLTSMGGIMGVIAGIVLAQVISKMSETPVALSIPAMLISVLFSMLIGIVFGLVPSIKAANLNPIDALRHE